MKKYLRIENFIYLLILLSPFFDSFSFIYRNINPTSTLSPITILRPIIPIILAIYLFFKYRESRKTLIIGGIIYAIYGFIHLFIYNNNIVGITFGNLLHEAQYVVNYTYMIMLLYIFIKFDDKIEVDKLSKVLLLTLIFYLALIYISIITNTSSNTYMEEAIGYKGWNLSGNSIGTILLLLEAITIPFILKQSKKLKIVGIITLILLGIFLTFMLGTRTGFFGFYLVLGVYIIANILIHFISKKSINLKKHLGIIIMIVGVSALLVIFVGSNTLVRRSQLKTIENDIIDPNTNDVSHVTGDSAVFVYQIKNNQLKDGFMSDDMKNAYLDMYNFANKHNVLSNDQRTQQLIYQTSLIKHQKSIAMILFGNGYGLNYGEMTLEMEVLAILFNFGIFGFILYLIPFLIIDFKGIKYIFKNIRKVDIELVMCMVGSFIAFIFSLLAGYTFFNPSSSIIIISIHLLIRKKYISNSFN